MNQATLFHPEWRWRGLALCNAIAFGILGSWLWQPTRQLWEQLDHAVFNTLNSPLATHPLWAHIWAIGSMRPADAGAALVMLLFLVGRNLIFSGTQVRSALFGFFSLLLLLTLFRVGLFSKVVDLMQWQHSSPSITVDGAVHLSTLFPDWESKWHMKDSSNQSFPGDHGAVLLLWALFLWPFARGLRRLAVIALLCLFMLPRLVAGAHWASDVFVGGLFLSLVTLGWGLYSPYAARVTSLLECWSAPILDPLSRLPGLNRISLFSKR